MVTISTQAQIAIYSLQPQDQRKVEERIRQLEHFPQDEYVRQQANRLTGYQDLYLVRVNPNLRLIFRYAGQQSEVLDIVTHDRLASMQPYARS
jgi:mRNA-degrading endonuclease RelE of RelBE toxin-antitoxin system